MSVFKSKFPGKKVLVVEDYFINQELTQEILEMMECEVEIAENGIEAIDKYKSGPYDLILMDVQMPEKDGLEATREIRSLEGRKSHIPIIALTANATQDDCEKCLSAGMDDYLSKPLDTTKLEELLNKHLSMHDKIA